MFDYLRILMECINKTPYFNQFDEVSMTIGSYINYDGDVTDVILSSINGVCDGMGYPLPPHKIVTLKDMRDLMGLYRVGFNLINFDDYLSHEDKYERVFNVLRRI